MVEAINSFPEIPFILSLFQWKNLVQSLIIGFGFRSGFSILLQITNGHPLDDHYPDRFQLPYLHLLSSAFLMAMDLGFRFLPVSGKLPWENYHRVLACSSINGKHFIPCSLQNLGYYCYEVPCKEVKKQFFKVVFFPWHLKFPFFTDASI